MRGSRRVRFGAATFVVLLACGHPPARSAGSASTRASASDSTMVDSTPVRAGPANRGMMRGGGMTPGHGMMRGGHMMSNGDTGAAPRPRPVPAAAAAGCPMVDTALVDAGRRIFAGPGNCQTCHGVDARGTALAPDLTDATWLNIDGSYGAIAGLVRRGVPHPKRYPGAMPPMGGATLTPPQVCAVAAYVYALGH